MRRRFIGHKESGNGLPSLYTGLLANYKLDETSGTTAIDETGSYNGVINGTPTLGVAANLGTGINFNNNSANFIDLQTRNLIGGRSSFTIAGWSKKLGSADGSLYGSWSGLRICNFGNNGILDRWINNIYIGGVLKGGNFSAPSAGAWDQQEYQLMICTYDGATLRTKVNNIESVDSYAVTGNVQTAVNSQTERIGSTGYIASNRTIPSLQIWDRAITDEEKTNLWNNGNGLIL